MLGFLVSCAMPGQEASEQNGEVGEHRQAIINGSATSDYPAAVVLRASLGGSSGLCTGTLIARRTVLTAAHCVVTSSGRLSPSQLQVGFGSDRNSAQYISVTNIRVHSGYNASLPPIAGLPSYDIAVVTLSADGPTAPIPLYRRPPQVGQRITFVGFGATNGTLRIGSGTKRQVAGLIGQVASTQWRYSASSGGGGSVCFGDSGGPAFVQANGGLAVIGVASTVADSSCTTTGSHMRIDTFLDFIGVPETPPEVTLSGTVVVAGAGTPIAGATVRLVGGSATAAAPAGSFTMTVPPGTHTLEASAPGYQTGTNSCNVVAGSSCPIGLTPIAPPPTPEPPTPPPAVTGAAQGLVYLYGTQTAVPNATVTVQQTGAQVLAPTGMFDVQLPPGSYSLMASAPGYQPGMVNCTVTAGAPTWCPVAVMPPAAPTAPDAGPGFGGTPPASGAPEQPALGGGCSALGPRPAWPTLLLTLLIVARRRRM